MGQFELYDYQREVVASDIFDIGAIKFGAFRLKLHETHPDAPLSPFYIDLRLFRSFPIQRKTAANLLRKYIAEQKIELDIYADIPTAITPLVTSLSDMTGVGFISPKIAKTHGLTGKIDGVCEKEQKVLLIDDIVTKADSKIEAAEVLKKNGLVVSDILVLVDREQGGKEALAQAGYKLHSIFRFSEMLEMYVETEKISQAQYDEISEYLRNN